MVMNFLITLSRLKMVSQVLFALIFSVEILETVGSNTKCTLGGNNANLSLTNHTKPSATVMNIEGLVKKIAILI